MEPLPPLVEEAPGAPPDVYNVAAPSQLALAKPLHGTGSLIRQGVKPPKFASKFASIDLAALPLPAISLFPKPQEIPLADVHIEVCGLECRPARLRWPSPDQVPPTILDPSAFICSIFNWVEMVQWGGIRVKDFMAHAGVEVPPDSFVAFYSRDGMYFESMPAAMALDPRTLLATHMDYEPLAHNYGGPVRLVVPFLQGYKSVKWVWSIRVFNHDPLGTKRLLKQSKTGILGPAWRQRYNIAHPAGVDDKVHV